MFFKPFNFFFFPFFVIIVILKKKNLDSTCYILKGAQTYKILTKFKQYLNLIVITILVIIYVKITSKLNCLNTDLSFINNFMHIETKHQYDLCVQ